MRALFLLTLTALALVASTSTQAQIDITAPGDPVLGIHGAASAGGTHLLSGVSGGPGPGYPAVESPPNAIDNSATTKYLNFAITNCGFVVTPSRGESVVTGLRFSTANDVPARDPLTFRLEGTTSGLDGNGNVLAGGAWSLIAQGDTGLQTDPGRNTFQAAGSQPSFANNNRYTSYRLVFTSVRDASTANSTQIGEVELLASLPVITVQPTSQIVYTGSNATFSVSATTAIPPLRYQWQFNGTNIDGATNDSLTISNVQPGNAGDYKVLVSDAVGSVGSDLANLSLLDAAAPTVTTLPASSINVEGATLHGTVNPNGAPATAYFEYGTSTAYGSLTPLVNLAAGGHLVSLSILVTGLEPQTTYHYRFVAVNSGGTSMGDDLSFTTTEPLPAYRIDLDFDQPLGPGLSTYFVSSLSSTGGVGRSGVLKLMTNVASSIGEFVIDDFSDGATVTSFSARFDLLMGGGTTTPGDGFSFNFATNFYHPANSPLPREEGFTNGLSVSFDSYDNGAGFLSLFGANDTAPAIETKTFLSQTAFQSMLGTRVSGMPAGPLLTNPVTGQALKLETELPAGQGPMTNFVPIGIDWLDGALWVTYNGILVLSNVQTLMPPVAAGKFALAARTGGSSENVWIDNLRIQTFTGPNPIFFTTTEPVNQRLDEGQAATFRASPFGNPPIAIQWYSNDVAIVGATNAIYTTPPATLANNGDVYRIEAVVGNGANATNRSATLVAQPVVFLSDGPTNFVSRNSQSATFRADLSGSLPVRIQWFSNDVAIVGATNATYTPPPPTLANDGDVYRILATNGVSSTNRSAVLFVPTLPTIVKQPENLTVAVGETAVFSVTVTNTATLPINYQWRKGALPLTNILLNSRTCSFALYNVQTNVTTTNGPGNYRVAITNAATTGQGIGSAQVVLTVTTTPALAAPILVAPVRQGNQFSVSVATVSGFVYYLERKTNLEDASWTAVANLPGNGLVQVLTDPSATDRQGFYRVRAH